MELSIDYSPLLELISQMNKNAEQPNRKNAMIFPELVQRLRKDTQATFAATGAYGGNSRWRPRKKTSAKTKLIASAKLLQNTGALKNSIRLLHQNLQQGTLVFGTDLPYAGYHQEGTRHIPQRRFLFLTPNTQKWLTLRLQQVYGEIL